MRNVRITNYDPSENIPSKEISLNVEPMSFDSDFDIIKDKKRLTRMVVELKGYIRKSGEYKRLIKFLKKKRGLHQCGNHPNITIHKGFNIHAHHAPYTLEDIVYTVIYKRVNLREDLKFTSIAREVMLLHYSGIIGLYPLCESCHDMIHDDEINDFIPFKLLYGEPVMFFELYKEHMAPELKTKSENIFEVNKIYDAIEPHVPQEVMRSYIYTVNATTGAYYIDIDKFMVFVDALNRL